MSHGTVTRLKNGQAPSGDLLAILQRVSNASIRWLTENRGPPFLVSRALSDSEGVEILNDLYDEPDRDTFLVRSGDRFAIVLTLPASFSVKDRMIDYISVDVLSGNLSQGTRQRAALGAAKGSVYQVDVTPAEFDRLSTGHLSHSALIGYHDKRRSRTGILDRATPLDSPVGVISDPVALVNSDAPDKLESDLLDRFRALSPENRLRIIRIAQVMESPISNPLPHP
ncbi:MAG: hypothetical protein GY703_09560 [Gammaproteobacteria bacterium]|nr:hypothetical protein [Gammaproteobacteria bacterium]